MFTTLMANRALADIDSGPDTSTGIGSVILSLALATFVVVLAVGVWHALQNGAPIFGAVGVILGVGLLIWFCFNLRSMILHTTFGKLEAFLLLALHLMFAFVAFLGTFRSSASPESKGITSVAIAVVALAAFFVWAGVHNDSPTRSPFSHDYTTPTYSNYR